MFILFILRSSFCTAEYMVLVLLIFAVLSHYQSLFCFLGPHTVLLGAHFVQQLRKGMLGGRVMRGQGGGGAGQVQGAILTLRRAPSTARAVIESSAIGLQLGQRDRQRSDDLRKRLVTAAGGGRGGGGDGRRRQCQ